MKYRGVVQFGVIVLDAPQTLPEGTRVVVEVLVQPETSGDVAGPPLLRLGDVAIDAGSLDLTTGTDRDSEGDDPG